MTTRKIGVTIPIRRGREGMFQQSYTVPEQVKSNFINLVLTKKGERLHQPDFGCDIHAVLFEQINEDTIELARQAVVNAVDKWMPFIELIEFNATQDSDHSLVVYFKYRFRNNPNVQEEIILRPI